MHLLYKEVIVVADPYDFTCGEIGIVTDYTQLLAYMADPFFAARKAVLCAYSGVLLPASFIGKELYSFPGIFAIYGSTVSKNEVDGRPYVTVMGEFCDLKREKSTREVVTTLQRKIIEKRVEIEDVFILVGIKEKGFDSIVGLDNTERDEAILLANKIRKILLNIEKVGASCLTDLISNIDDDVYKKKYEKIAHLLATI